MWGRRGKRMDDETASAAADVPPPLSLGKLIKRLIEDVSRLIRSEFRVAQAEFGANISKASAPLTLVLLGVVLLIGGLFTLLGALVAWLTLLVGAGLAALIVAAGAGTAGYALLLAGRKQLAEIDFLPTRVANAIKDDPNAFEGHEL